MEQQTTLSQEHATIGIRLAMVNAIASLPTTQLYFDEATIEQAIEDAVRSEPLLAGDSALQDAAIAFFEEFTTDKTPQQLTAFIRETQDSALVIQEARERMNNDDMLLRAASGDRGLDMLGQIDNLEAIQDHVETFELKGEEHLGILQAREGQPAEEFGLTGEINEFFRRQGMEFGQRDMAAPETDLITFLVALFQEAFGIDTSINTGTDTPDKQMDKAVQEAGVLDFNTDIALSDEQSYSVPLSSVASHTPQSPEQSAEFNSR